MSRLGMEIERVEQKLRSVDDRIEDLEGNNIFILNPLAAN